jgi:hypothetical protein
MILENRRVTIDEVANHFTLVMVLHMTSFITGLAFIKSVQDGFLNSSPKSTETIVWPSVNAYWTAMLTKVKLF